jgi:hypothetical protein
MTNQQIINRFVNGATSGRNSNRSLFIDGNTIYSYGHHFPLAHRNADGTFWVNPDKYSVTTSKQQGLVRRAIPSLLLVA